jgi:hypothetical protein
MNKQTILLKKYINEKYSPEDVTVQILDSLEVIENSITSSMIEIFRLSMTVKCCAKCKRSCDTMNLCDKAYFQYNANKISYENEIIKLQKNDNSPLPTYHDEVVFFLKGHNLDSKSALLIVNKFEEFSTEQLLQ